jgi:hypothetical protein
MSANYGEEYTLGEEITKEALGRKTRDTVVVSVRLTSKEFSRLEGMCEETGKSMSQIVRDAIATYHAGNTLPPSVFWMTMRHSDGSSVSVGPREYTSHSCYPVMIGLGGSNQLSSRLQQMPEAQPLSIESFSQVQ